MSSGKERNHFTTFSSRSSCVRAGIMAERPNVVQQKLHLIELMRENAWMVDKSDPKYKNRGKKAEKWEEIAAILGEEGK